MTPDVTQLHSINSSRAVRQSRPLATPRAAEPVDSLQLSAEARQSDQLTELSPALLGALGLNLKAGPQLPHGAHATMRVNVEKALRLRHLSENERLQWLQTEVTAGGSMDYRQQHHEGPGQRLRDRNCGAVGAALALRQESILKAAGPADLSQVKDGIRESQRYLNGEPSQLGQRGRRQPEISQQRGSNMLNYADIG